MPSLIYLVRPIVSVCNLYVVKDVIVLHFVVFFFIQVKYRVAWTKHEERIKQREKAAIEKERAMYAQIDWHDFVVVETVDFMPDERGRCYNVVLSQYF